MYQSRIEKLTLEPKSDRGCLHLLYYVVRKDCQFILFFGRCQHPSRKALHIPHRRQLHLVDSLELVSAETAALALVAKMEVADADGSGHRHSGRPEVLVDVFPRLLVQSAATPQRQAQFSLQAQVPADQSATFALYFASLSQHNSSLLSQGRDRRDILGIFNELK